MHAGSAESRVGGGTGYNPSFRCVMSPHSRLCPTTANLHRRLPPVTTDGYSLSPHTRLQNRQLVFQLKMIIANSELIRSATMVPIYVWYNRIRRSPKFLAPSWFRVDLRRHRQDRRKITHAVQRRTRRRRIIDRSNPLLRASA